MHATELKSLLNSIEENEKRMRTLYERYTRLPKKDFDKYFHVSGSRKDSTFALQNGMIDEIREIRLPPFGKNLVTIVTSPPEQD